MVFKNFIKETILLSGAIIASVFVSCNSSDEPNSKTHSQEIGFNTGLSSKAVVHSIDDLNDFQVWAYYKKEGIDWLNVFNTEIIKVSKLGSDWTYDPKSYWFDDYLYEFHAFYPTTLGTESDPTKSNISIDEETKKIITIDNFDATMHVDLMYSSHERYYSKNEGNSDPVKVNFRHLLSQVTFVGKVDGALFTQGVDVKLTSAKLYGIVKKGKWESDKNPQWTLSTDISDMTNSDNSFSIYENEILLGANGIKNGVNNGVDLFTGDNEIITFPLTRLSGVIFELKYVYMENGIEKNSKTQTIDLGSIVGAPSSWEAGKSYKYSFIVNSSDYILFSAPAVDEWTDYGIGEGALDDKNQN